MSSTPLPYRSPAIQIGPPDPEQPWPGEHDPAGRGGWRIRVLLDTRTGLLSAEPNTGRDQRGRAPLGSNYLDRGRGLWVQATPNSRLLAWTQTPRLLGWETPRPMTLAALTDLLERAHDAAGLLLIHLAAVPGTAAWDWTVTAATAHRVIQGLVAGDQDADADRRRLDAALTDPRYRSGLVDLRELLELCPEFADPAWDGLDVAGLDAVARDLARGPHRLFDVADTIRAYHGWAEHVRLAVVGTRIGLRSWQHDRVVAATGRPPRHAADHFAKNMPEGLVDADDDALARLSTAEEQVAADRDGVTLLGARNFLQNTRDRQRSAVRAELARVGEETAALTAQLRRLTGARTSLVRQILAWGEHTEWDNDGQPRAAAIAHSAGITRQGAAQLLARLLRSD